MTRVVKIGGRPQSDPTLAERIARTIGNGSFRTILVHGGGDEISLLQRTLGGETRFVDGRRVTTAADIDLIRMALSGLANKRLVSSLLDHGVSAVGLSGEDGSLLKASPCDPARLGRVGVPEHVNVSLLELLTGGGYLPVISPVSRNSRPDLEDVGSTLNVNGDDAAAAIAVAIGAHELLFVSDVAGVMDDGKVVGQLTPRDIRMLLAEGVATGGMSAKLRATLVALDGGVPQVRVSDLDALNDPDRGTVITA